MFFDKPGVIDKVDEANRRNLSKFGSHVRTRARRSIRKRKKSAPAGQPPYSHQGMLRDLIFFGYDQSSKSVVVGAALSNRTRRRVSTKRAPQLLEFGGTTTLFGGKVAEYAGNPYMGPAFREELPRFAGLFANSVK